MDDRVVAVTGGAGFIGSHLVRELVSRGTTVRVLDDFSTGQQDNLAGLDSQIEIVRGDIRILEDCARACEAADVVYHLAALGSVPRSIEDPITTNAVNVDGTLNILWAAHRAGVRRVVFSSSSSVYGDTPVLPKAEHMQPQPMSPYAASKLSGERYCQVFARSYGLETVSLRYFNVFGPRQDPNSQYAAVIPRFIAALLDERRPVIYGDGEQTRDFTYVSNVVNANLLAAEAQDASGRVFNVACGERISINTLLATIAAKLGKAAVAQHVNGRTGDVRDSLADIAAARAALGYEPQVSVQDGLSRTVAAYVGAAGKLEQLAAANA